MIPNQNWRSLPPTALSRNSHSNVSQTTKSKSFVRKKNPSKNGPSFNTTQEKNLTSESITELPDPQSPEYNHNQSEVPSRPETRTRYSDKEKLQAFLERPPSQPGANTAFKSTLANLSAALATLDEGDYLQWENHPVPTSNKTPVQIAKSRQQTREKTNFRRVSQPISGTHETFDNNVSSSREVSKRIINLNKVHNGMNLSIEKKPKDFCLENQLEHPDGIRVGNLRWKRLRSVNESMDLNSINNNASPNTNKNFHIEDSPGGVILVSGKASGSMTSAMETFMRSESFDIGVPSPPLESRRMRQSVGTSKAKQSLRMSDLSFEDWKLEKDEKEEKEGKSVEPKRPKIKKVPEIKKADFVLPKLNIGGFETDNPVGSTKEGEIAKVTELANDLNSKLKGRFVPQWKPKKLVAGGKQKDVLKRLSIDKGIPRITKEEWRHIKRDDSSQNRYDSPSPSPVQGYYLGQAGTPGYVGRVMWDEDDTEKAARRTYIEGVPEHSQVGKFPTLAPKLKVKKDLIGFRKHLLPFRNKNNVVIKEVFRDTMNNTPQRKTKKVEKVQRELGRSSSIDEEIDKMTVPEDDEMVRLQDIFEEKMRKLEEKYVGVYDGGLKQLQMRNEKRRRTRGSYLEEVPQPTKQLKSVDSMERKRRY